MASVVICGAGIAGIAAAHHLSVVQGVRNVVLVDERQPLTLTSDKSTEAYRDWWPGPDDAMLRLMQRSITLLEGLAEATGNAFHMNRRGYFYATADAARAESMQQDAEAISAMGSAMGAGALRVHGAGSKGYQPAPQQGYRDGMEGADLILDKALIRQHFPFVAPDIVAVLHARRCGWFSGQQLGMLLLEQARAAGVRLVRGRVVEVTTQQGRVRGVVVQDAAGVEEIATPIFVNAAGPHARSVGALAGMELPLFSELHVKIAFDDKAGAVPRGAGLWICEDPIALAWDEETRSEMAADVEMRWLTEPLPAGVHMRPEGHGAESRSLLVLWAYHTQPVAERFPIAPDEMFGEVALRGIARLIPGLSPYAERLPRYVLDGGYYTKTAENRPLIGAAGVAGAYVLAGLSGFGLMAACAAGELLAAHVLGRDLPAYAAAFSPARYRDAAYMARLTAWGSKGQL